MSKKAGGHSPTLFVVFVILGVFLLWAANAWDSASFLLAALAKFDGPHWTAFLSPIFFVIVFACSHKVDKKSDVLRGMIWSLRQDKDAELADSLDSAIARQAIQSAIGLGVAAALCTIGEIWKMDDKNMARYASASLTVSALGFSTLLALVSVLCYSQGKRWRETTKSNKVMHTREVLIDKAAAFDHASWYALMVGLLWAVAIANPAASVLANIAYCVCLFIYYFAGW